MSPLRVGGFLAAVLLASACGQKTDAHPKGIQCSNDASCVGDPSHGGGGSDGGLDGSAGAAGAAGSAGASDASVSVTGLIGSYLDDTFSDVAPFTDLATVELEGPTGIGVQGAYDGQTFLVEGAAYGSDVWASVVPKGPGMLTTVQPADTTTGQSITLGVIPAFSIDQIYALGTIPTTRVAGAACLVLRFVTADLHPVLDVTLQNQTATVIYDSAGTWSDTQTGTGPLGLAVVVNYVAGTNPSLQQIEFTTPAVPNGAVVDVRVVPDAATILNVLVP
jgi:hypothetical protein